MALFNCNGVIAPVRAFWEFKEGRRRFAPFHVNAVRSLRLLDPKQWSKLEIVAAIEIPHNISYYNGSINAHFFLQYGLHFNSMFEQVLFI